MKTILYFQSLLFFLLGLSKGYTQESKKLALGEQPVFSVCKTDLPIDVDEQMNEEAWSKTEKEDLTISKSFRESMTDNKLLSECCGMRRIYICFMKWKINI